MAEPIADIVEILFLRGVINGPRAIWLKNDAPNIPADICAQRLLDVLRAEKEINNPPQYFFDE